MDEKVLVKMVRRAISTSSGMSDYTDQLVKSIATEIAERLEVEFREARTLDAHVVLHNTAAGLDMSFPGVLAEYEHLIRNGKTRR